MSEKQVGVFYLGDEYPGIYFTKREVECLVYLLEGHTLVSAARLLGLSPRTVEFYVKNMRLKTGAHNKGDLVKKILGTNFTEQLGLLSVPMRGMVLKAAEPDPT